MERLIALVMILSVLLPSTVLSNTVAPPLPTPAPTPQITSRDDACQVANTELAQIEAAFTAQQIASYTGCVQSGYRWVWPSSSGSDDVRKPHLFDEPEEAALVGPRQKLNSELNLFLLDLSRQASPFVVGGSETMLESIQRFTEFSCSLRSGLYGFNRGAPGEFTVVDTYVNFVISTVGMANRPWLTMFISWWLSDRWSARPIAIDSMNPLARQGFDSAMYWDRAPWPFEIRADHIQDRFFRFMIDTGRVPF